MADIANIKKIGSISNSFDLGEFFRKSAEQQMRIDGSGSTFTGVEEMNEESWSYITGTKNKGARRQFIVMVTSSNPSGIYIYYDTTDMTRMQFYDYIDYWIILPGDLRENRVGWFSIHVDGTKLYTFVEPRPLTEWTIKQLTDWGKIKSLELMYFKSVGNGFNLADKASPLVHEGDYRPLYQSLKGDVSGIQLTTSLEYLRCGLTRFGEYRGYEYILTTPN